jgi:hypothetical protein
MPIDNETGELIVTFQVGLPEELTPMEKSTL